MKATVRCRSRSLALAVASLGALGTGLLAQPQAPIFRATAELVEVIVRVTDEQGRFIPSLTADDFEIRDEGLVQRIVAFDRRDVPRSPTPFPRGGRPVLAMPEMSTVVTNQGVDHVRLFVLVLDGMNTSSSYTIPVRKAARDFVERYVEPSDLVSIYSTDGRAVTTQDFTADKTRVLATVDRFWGTGVSFGYYGEQVAIDVLKALGKHLAGIRGRRVSLVWISERGIGEADHAGRKAIESLRRANVTVYAVDPRKLFVPGAAEMDTLGSGTVAQTIPRWGEWSAGGSPDSLRTFAEATGGFAAIHTNDFDEAFERILDESSRYYVLGFQPAERGHEGAFRGIQVRVRSQPTFRVSARPGYVVGSMETPRPRPTDVTPALAEAIVSSVPTGGLPIRMQAIPRRSKVPGRLLVHVVIEVAGRELSFASVGKHYRTQLEFALRTIDFLGRSDNNRKATLTFNLTPAEFELVRHTGVRWLSTLDMPAGRYNLRVAARAVGSNKSGSVFADLDVPKLDDDTLWIGGLALTSLPAILATTGGTTTVGLGLPTPPTTGRIFVAGDVLTISAEIATPREFDRGSVQLAVHTQSDPPGSRPILEWTVELSSRDAAHRSRSFAVPTGALGVGDFVLRLTVRDTNGRRAETAVLFEVVSQ